MKLYLIIIQLIPWKVLSGIIRIEGSKRMYCWFWQHKDISLHVYVVGAKVGANDDGAKVGANDDGTKVGAVGLAVGFIVNVGVPVGRLDGCLEGCPEGCEVGRFEGLLVLAGLFKL